MVLEWEMRMVLKQEQKMELEQKKNCAGTKYSGTDEEKEKGE